MATWVRWGKGRSWHVTKGNRTRCGRRVPSAYEECSDVPMDEKTCERCAVLTLHDEAKAA